MTSTLTLRNIGNSVGAVFPKDILKELNIEQGDKLFLTKTPNGYSLSPYDPEFEERLKVAEEVMKENRDLLKRLAE